MFERFKKIYYRYKAFRFLDDGVKKNRIFINGKCRFTPNCHIGNNCHFNGMVINGDGKVFIGDNFHSGTECLIITQNHNYDSGERLPYDNSYIVKNITIGKNVWLGSRVILLPGTVLGDGCIVQAGSVVHGKIPRLAIVGGNPATVIKYRDEEHYTRLENAGLYS